MKIVHIIFGFKTGGSETMLVDILNEQARMGHDVTLAVINDCYDNNVLTKVCPIIKKRLFKRKASSRNPIIIFRLNWFLWKQRPDVVHIHNEYISRLLLLRFPIFLTVHSLGIDFSSSCVKLTELFAISDAVKADVEQRYPGKYKVKTISNGIRLDTIERKKIYGYNEDVLKIVQVGSVVSRIKGQDLLIKAIALLKERGIYGIEISFIGEPYEEENLSKMSSELGVESQVCFLGLKDRKYIYSHLKDYDLMCHPSRQEGFGLTVAEGIAAGLPVLVPDADGPYEIIKYGELGYTFKKGNVDSLADALQDIYEHYQERATHVVDDAYEHVKANYSIQHMVEQYIEEYQKSKQ